LFAAIYKYKEDKETVEMNSELLCKLMTTIGKLIDTPEAKSYMDTYFTHINKLSQDVNFSSRIRFMFQAVLELRQNNWIPRREENAPKKISEVHADAIQQQYVDELNLAQPVEQQKVQVAPVIIETKEKDGKKKPSKPKKKKKKPIEKRGSNADPQPDDDLEQRITDILKEFTNNADATKATTAIKELKDSNSLSKVIELGVIITLERTDHDRELMSKFFTNLSSQTILIEEHFVKGFKSLLESLNDLELDIPYASKLIGVFLGNAVAERCLSVSWVEAIEERVKRPMMEVISKMSQTQ